MAIAARICEYDGGAQLVKEETRAVKREKDAAAARQATSQADLWAAAYAVGAYMVGSAGSRVGAGPGVRVPHALDATCAVSSRLPSHARLQTAQYCLIVATRGAAAAAAAFVGMHSTALHGCRSTQCCTLTRSAQRCARTHLAATAGADRPAHARARQDPPRRVSRVQPHRAGTRYR